MVTNLLNQYLGQFLEGLDPEQLKISIWGGERRAAVADTAHSGERGERQRELPDASPRTLIRFCRDR